MEWTQSKRDLTLSNERTTSITTKAKVSTCQANIHFRLSFTSQKTDQCKLLWTLERSIRERRTNQKLNNLRYNFCKRRCSKTSHSALKYP